MLMAAAVAGSGAAHPGGASAMVRWPLLRPLGQAGSWLGAVLLPDSWYTWTDVFRSVTALDARAAGAHIMPCNNGAGGRWVAQPGWRTRKHAPGGGGGSAESMSHGAWLHKIFGRECHRTLPGRARPKAGGPGADTKYQQRLWRCTPAPPVLNTQWWQGGVLVQRADSFLAGWKKQGSSKYRGQECERVSIGAPASRPPTLQPIRHLHRVCVPYVCAALSRCLPSCITASC